MWDTPDSLDESYATYLLPTYRRAVDTEPAEEPIHGAKEQREKKAYFSKVEIRDLHVAKDAFDDWAVFGEVKNIGDRTLTKVEITIYYLDRYGDPVYEQVQRPVHCSAWLSDDQPLKPNYSQKFGYEADDAPSEWAREIRGVVSDIEFEE
jgi:hypothetical protein